jgi:hypothetical protein
MTNVALLIAPVALSVPMLIGCGVQRSIKIDSEPQGALVYLNQQEVGRTPMEREFTWYGTYDVQLRLDGYETLRTREPVIAPLWQWPPFDLFAELLPFRPKDIRQYRYTLVKRSENAVSPQDMLSRAGELKGGLESSRYRQSPATRPE